MKTYILIVRWKLLRTRLNSSQSILNILTVYLQLCKLLWSVCSIFSRPFMASMSRARELLFRQYIRCTKCAVYSISRLVTVCITPRGFLWAYKTPKVNIPVTFLGLTEIVLFTAASFVIAFWHSWFWLSANARCLRNRMIWWSK